MRILIRVLNVLILASLLLPLGCGGGEPAPSVTPYITHTPLPTFTPVQAAPPTAEPTATATPAPTPTPTPRRPDDVNPYTGLRVDDPTKLQRRPLLIKIENHKHARPQFGLTKADLVYEYRIEYGFTRFAALFITETPEKVGPARSARPMDVELVPQHDAALCFSGAAVPTKKLMNEAGIVRMGNDKYSEPYYYRVNRGPDIAWEHTLYTNVAELRKLLASLGEERPAPQQGFIFDQTPPQGQPVIKIEVNFSSSAVASYTYNPETKRYKRQFNGEDFLDAETGAPIENRNIIVQFVKGEESIFVNDALGGTYLYVYEMIGEGRALVFRDGVMVEGKWQRRETNQETLFLDGDGNEVKLAPGATWILCVLVDQEVKVE